MRAAWLRRWEGLLGCTAARSLSCSLLDGSVDSGADGAIPSLNTAFSEARYASAVLFPFVRRCTFFRFSCIKKKKKEN